MDDLDSLCAGVDCNLCVVAAGPLGTLLVAEAIGIKLHIKCATESVHS